MSKRAEKFEVRINTRNARGRKRKLDSKTAFAFAALAKSIYNKLAKEMTDAQTSTRPRRRMPRREPAQ